MTTSQWGAIAIAALGVVCAGCAGDKFSACDDCEAGAGGNGTGGGSGDGGTTGEAGSSGASGSSGSGGAAGAPDAGSDSAGSAGTAGSGGTAGTGMTEGGERFPRSSVLDNFNRADGPPGGNWVGNTSSFQIKNQRLAFVSGACQATFWQSLFGAEQEVFARLASVDPAAAEINVVLKAQELSDCELLEVLYSPSQQRLELHYCTEGTWHVIDGMPLTLQSGDQLGARYHPNHRVHIYVNGVRTTVFDASAYPHRDRGGRIGVNCQTTPNGATAWDDFGGG